MYVDDVAYHNKVETIKRSRCIGAEFLLSYTCLRKQLADELVWDLKTKQNTKTNIHKVVSQE